MNTPDNGMSDVSGKRSVETRLDDLKSSTTKAAHTLRDSASEKFGEARDYVRDRGARGMISDLAGAAREHPLAAIGIGVSLGYLVGRVMKRR